MWTFIASCKNANFLQHAVLNKCYFIHKCSVILNSITVDTEIIRNDNRQVNLKGIDQVSS